MKSALAILIGALALLIGYFSHRAVNPSAKTHQQVRTDDGSSSTRTIHSQRRSLERAMRTPESTQRWLRVVALLEKATLDDMQGIAEAAGFSDLRITKMIGQHWLDLDPQHLFDTSFKEMNRKSVGKRANFACFDYIRLLAEKWPQQDLNAAIAAFSQADPKFLLSDYQDQFVNYLIAVDLGKAIELSKNWNHSLRDSYGFLKKTVEDDPVKAAHAILSQYQTNKLHLHRDPFNPYQYTYEGEPLIRILAETWGKNDPINALAFASSFKTNQGEYLQKGILEQWARLDDEAAGHWLDQQAQEIQDKYRPTLIKAWATEDPQEALAWCNEHLDNPTAYQAAVKSLINGALEGDLTKATELLPNLPDLVHQQTILSNVASTRFTPNKEGEIPASAIAWIRDMGNTPLAGKAAAAAAYNWTHHDPGSMKAYLEEERDFIYPISAYDQLIRTLIRQNPISAMEWTTGLAKQSEGASHRAANTWLIQSPETAITWLRESRDHTPSHEAMHKFLSSFMTYKDATDTMLPKLSAKNKAWLTTHFPEKK